MARLQKYDRKNENHNLYPGTAITYTIGGKCVHLSVVFNVHPWDKGREIETNDGTRLTFKDVETFANPEVR